jgi:hypothetical protein
MNNIIYINNKRYDNLAVKATAQANQVRLLVLNDCNDLGPGMVLLVPSDNTKYDAELINQTQGTQHSVVHWLENVERVIISN